MKLKVIGTICIDVDGSMYAEQAERAAEGLARKHFLPYNGILPYDERPPTAEERAHPDYKSVSGCMTRGLPTWSYSFVVCRY